MDESRWARIKDVFSLAIAHGADAAEQMLRKACAGDEELLSLVRPMVSEHFRILEADTEPKAAEESEIHSSRIIAGRYRVISRLGGGTFGDVYHVSDEMDGRRELALKILRSSDPLAIQYFKRERRTLADIHHDNIIRVYELHEHEHQLFFTMELVDGVGFLRHLTAQPVEQRDAKLRSCLVQLAEGLRMLHSRKLLHRDLKPSNVLVTREGRVVLLDFGLVRSIDEGFHSRVTFAGTPDYMAPEQVVGQAASEASDWYAIGVMLYQSLTGQLPFNGNFVEVLHSKQLENPTAAAEVAHDVPSDLNELCNRLLERDPSKRGSYEDVLRLSGRTQLSEEPAFIASSIVGRVEPLRKLTEAVFGSEDRPTLIHLCGPSGIGKTSLLREFITRLRKDPTVLVFSGRCFEGESIPYQALDDLIDHIGQYLRHLPGDHVERILPRNFSLLVRMFPVLAPFLSSDIRPASPLNSVELRSRALSALRELFGRLRERNRIVLAIDDLQWGDVDGCVALKDVFSAPDSPSIVGIFAYRSEDILASSSLKVLRSDSAGTVNRKTTFINLDQFDLAECRQLAESMLGRTPAENTAELLLEQSEGNPFLIHEIVRWMSERSGDGIFTERFSLTDVVRSRMDQLSPEARHLLELAAIAGQPTELSILQLAGSARNLLLTRDELISNRLFRSRSVRGREEVEIYHDRLRATIVSAMNEAERAQCHRELGRALEASGGHDAERIAAHYLQSGDAALCARYALIAARRAAEVLAFHDAARFFQMALETGSLEQNAERIVHRECADSLANTGRGPLAADHYLLACKGATEDEQLELNLRAAEELLCSGHVDRGLAILMVLLKKAGLKISDRSYLLPLELLVGRLKLKIRGLRWRERRETEISRKELERLDVCGSAVTSLALAGGMQAAILQTSRLMLALRVGEPSRLARALAMEAAYRSTGGVKSQQQTDQLLQSARELSDRVGDKRATAFISAITVICDWNAGRWKDCYEHSRTAQEILRDQFERLTWERDIAVTFKVCAMRWLGRWSELKMILPGLLADARARGDLFAESALRAEFGVSCELANHQPDSVLEGLEVWDRWSTSDSLRGGQRTQQSQKHSELGFVTTYRIHTLVEGSLYRGNGKEAFDAVMTRWPDLKRSHLLVVQTIDIEMRSLLAKAALATAAEEKSEHARRPLLKIAERQVRLLKHHEAPWGIGLAELIQGGIESLLNRDAEAVAAFERAEKLFDSLEMRLHKAVAQWSKGLLTGGVDGRKLAKDSEALMRSEGILYPERIVAVIAPGSMTS